MCVLLEGALLASKKNDSADGVLALLDEAVAW